MFCDLGHVIELSVRRFGSFVVIFLPVFKDENYMYSILHHGAASGVTGSCHELRLDSGNSLLVDCGMFQGG